MKHNTGSINRPTGAQAACGSAQSAWRPQPACLSFNTVSINGLTGAQATGQSALESLNGVAVEAVVLPEAGR
jgi:hypothetical protein